MSAIDKIRKNYIEYLLENQTKPTVFNLCKKAKIKEEEFYEHYNSVLAIESDIWKGLFEETKQKVQSEEVYASYTIREKLLAFYYTWIEVLKSQRSYILYHFEGKQIFNPRQNNFLKDFKESFEEYAQELVAEGRETGEIAERPFITDRYNKVLWWQVLTILDFWIKDTSKSFEKTDVFIEKSVNFAFDVISYSVLDSSFDYLKFIFQNR